MTPPTLLLWGEGRNAAGPRYWVSDDASTDDGQSNAILLETNPISPDGLGGEVLFTTCYLTITAAAGAVLSVTPIVDDVEPVDTVTLNGGTVRVVVPTIAIPQQTGTPPIAAVTATYQVPLLVELVRSGVVQSHWYPRGARCAIRVASVGAIGTGVFRIDAMELEVEPLRNVQRGTITIGSGG